MRCWVYLRLDFCVINLSGGTGEVDLATWDSSMRPFFTTILRFSVEGKSKNSFLTRVVFGAGPTRREPGNWDQSAAFISHKAFSDIPRPPRSWLPEKAHATFLFAWNIIRCLPRRARLPKGPTKHPGNVFHRDATASDRHNTKTNPILRLQGGDA